MPLRTSGYVSSVWLQAEQNVASSKSIGADRVAMATPLAVNWGTPQAPDPGVDHHGPRCVPQVNYSKSCPPRPIFSAQSLKHAAGGSRKNPWHANGSARS